MRTNNSSASSGIASQVFSASQESSSAYGTSSATASSVTSGGSVSKSSQPELISTINSGSYYLLKNDVIKTLCERNSDCNKPYTLKTAFDLNKDGKNDNIEIKTVSQSKTYAQKCTLTVNGKSITDYTFGFAGAYIVDINKDDNEIELAVEQESMSDDIYTYFYRYDGSLIELGDILGTVSTTLPEGYSEPIQEYNYFILTDGKGKLIPRFGLMQYISPNILLNGDELTGSKISPFKVNFTDVLNRSYTISMNTKPYLQQNKSDPDKLDFLYSKSEKINLQKGDGLTITQISTQEYNESACVKLSNGKQGILYYFLHP